MLRSSRSPEFFDIEVRRKAFENLKRRGIEKLIVIGGDGSFRALNQFYNDFGVPFAGIPATIDNDIAGTDYCLGVDTALNVIRESVDSLEAGQTNSIMIYRNGNYGHLPIHAVTDSKYQLDPALLRLAGPLAS